MKSNLDHNIIKVLSIIKTWLIIDKRMDIFRLAIVTAEHDVNSALPWYFEVAFHAMTVAAPVDQWKPPKDEVLGEIERRGNVMMSSLMTLQAYIFDFLREMQRLLLGRCLISGCHRARLPILRLWSFALTGTTN